MGWAAGETVSKGHVRCWLVLFSSRGEGGRGFTSGSFGLVWFGLLFVVPGLLCGFTKAEVFGVFFCGGLCRVVLVVMWCHSWSWSGGGCGWLGWDLDGGLFSLLAGRDHVNSAAFDCPRECGLRVVCRDAGGGGLITPGGCCDSSARTALG